MRIWRRLGVVLGSKIALLGIDFRGRFRHRFWERYSSILEIISVPFSSPEARASTKSAFFKNTVSCGRGRSKTRPGAPRGGRKRENVRDFQRFFPDHVFGAFLVRFRPHLGLICGAF